MYLACNSNLKHSSIPADKPELRAISEDSQLGYFILYVEEEGLPVEMCTLLKFTSSIYFMGSEEMIAGVKIKYCDTYVEDNTGQMIDTKIADDDLIVDQCE